MKPEDLTPDQVLQLAALGFVLISLLAASITSWGILFYRISQGFRFQTSSRPTASVGFVDCLICLWVVVSCFALAVATWKTFVNPKDVAAVEVSAEVTDEQANRESATVQDLASDASEESKEKKKPKISKEDVLGSGWVSMFQLLAAFVTMTIVAGRLGWDWRALGLSSTGVFRDMGIGAWVLFLMLPPIFLVNIATSMASGIEYSHPIIDAIKTYPWLVGVVAFQAVIVAPITEEFLFRGILIGWFESAHFGRKANAILFGWKPKANLTDQTDLQAAEPIYSGGRDDKLSPYSAPASQSAGLEAAGHYSPPWWPAILSGVLFGLAHFSYGVSWVPLIVFGIIMGRVYQIRQSLVLCIVVHMLFNGINIFNLWLSLGLPTQK
ncbi:MAG: CPBP family intramembrane metalloprotease [Pirellula sp.]|jgi:membrane protease YdiL (CAAX protease family)|nr:CPBP family intramembrane metalloprotease [Pirellula sp.]